MTDTDKHSNDIEDDLPVDSEAALLGLTAEEETKVTTDEALAEAPGQLEEPAEASDTDHPPSGRQAQPATNADAPEQTNPELAAETVAANEAPEPEDAIIKELESALPLNSPFNPNLFQRNWQGLGARICDLFSNNNEQMQELDQKIADLEGAAAGHEQSLGELRSQIKTHAEAAKSSQKAASELKSELAQIKNAGLWARLFKKW